MWKYSRIWTWILKHFFLHHRLLLLLRFEAKVWWSLAAMTLLLIFVIIIVIKETINRHFRVVWILATFIHVADFLLFKRITKLLIFLWLLVMRLVYCLLLQDLNVQSGRIFPLSICVYIYVIKMVDEIKSLLGRDADAANYLHYACSSLLLVSPL